MRAGAQVCSVQRVDLRAEREHGACGLSSGVVARVALLLVFGAVVGQGQDRDRMVPRPGSMLHTCTECVRAGLGWSLRHSACSVGFANRKCPLCWRSLAGSELELTSPPGLSMSTFSVSGRPIISQFRPSSPRQAAECAMLVPGNALQSVDGRAVRSRAGAQDGAVEGLTPAEAVAAMHGDKWPLRLTFTTTSEELPAKSGAVGVQPSASDPSYKSMDQSRKLGFDDEQARKRAMHITALLPPETLAVANEEADEWELRRRQLLGQVHTTEQTSRPQPRLTPPSPPPPRRRHFSDERPAETRLAWKRNKRGQEAVNKAAQKKQAEEYRTAMMTLTTMLHECDPVYLGAQIGWTAEVFRKSLSPTTTGVICEVDMVAVDAICGDEANECLKILADLADHPEPGLGWTKPGAVLLSALDEAAAAAEEEDQKRPTEAARKSEPQSESTAVPDDSCQKDGTRTADGINDGDKDVAVAGTSIWSLFFG